MLQQDERRKLWLLTACSALVSLADIASLAVLLLVVRLYTDGQVQLPFLPGQWLTPASLMPVAVCLLLFVLKNSMGYFVYHAQSAFVHRVAARISRQQLQQYLDGSYPDHVSEPAAARIHRINHEPVEFAQYVLSGLQQIAGECLLALIAVGGILAYSGRLFVLLALFLTPPLVLVSWFIKKRLRQVRQQVKADAESTTQYLQEALGAYADSNIYGRKDFFINRHSVFQQKLNRHLSLLQVTQWIPSRVVEIFAVLGLFFLIWLNRYHGMAVDIINIGAFMAAAYKIIPGIVRVANLSAQVRTYGHTVYDLQPLPQAVERPAEIALLQSLSLSDIHFAYDGKTILQHFSLEIVPGDFIDIVAPSGKGKTTLFNLLAGFLSPAAGTVLINGILADSAMLRGLRRHMAYVQQQPFLIHDSIRKNITLEEQTSDEQRLQYAIQAAGLEPFIAVFDEGIDKIISDHGKNISGGQRKRIMLARALYRDASLLLLDEPFSELDAAAEQQLLEVLQQLARQGKMILLITHKRISEAYCTKTVWLHEEA